MLLQPSSNLNQSPTRASSTSIYNERRLVYAVQFRISRRFWTITAAVSLCSLLQLCVSISSQTNIKVIGGLVVWDDRVFVSSVSCGTTFPYQFFYSVYRKNKGAAAFHEALASESQSSLSLHISGCYTLKTTTLQLT